MSIKFEHYETIRKERMKHQDNIKATTEEIIALCVSHWDDILYSIGSGNIKYNDVMNEFRKRFEEFDEKIIGREIIKRGLYPPKFYKYFYMMMVYFIILIITNITAYLTMMPNVTQYDFVLVNFLSTLIYFILAMIITWDIE